MFAQCIPGLVSCLCVCVCVCIYENITIYIYKLKSSSGICRENLVMHQCICRRLSHMGLVLKYVTLGLLSLQSERKMIFSLE